MYKELTEFIWFTDKILFAAAAFLSVAIVVYTVRKQEIFARRIFYLERVKDVMRVLSVLDKEAVKQSCPEIIAKIRPEDVIEISRFEKIVIPEELSQDFQNCLRESKTMDELIREAKSAKDKWVRIRGLLAVGSVGVPGAIDILKRALDDKDEDIAYFAMIGLSQLSSRQAGRALIDLISKRKFSGQKIASLLENFSYEVEDELIEKLDSHDDAVRFWSLRILASFKGNKWLKEAIRLSEDPSADVRAASCVYMGQTKSIEATGPLKSRLKDKAWFVRLQAVRALYMIEHAQALPDISSCLSDDNWFVREEVKKAMSSHPQEVSAFAIDSLNDSKVDIADGLEVMENSGLLQGVFEDIFSDDRSRSEKALKVLKAIVDRGGRQQLERFMDRTYSGGKNKVQIAIEKIKQ